MKPILARDFMATRLVTLRPETDVFEAIRLLMRSRISGAPVVDRRGKFLGVFTEQCGMHVLLDAACDDLACNTVEAFMDRDAQTIAADAPLLSIAQFFLLTPYRRLPVLDEDGCVVGLVSRRDVISAAACHLQPKAEPQRAAGAAHRNAVSNRDPWALG